MKIAVVYTGVTPELKQMVEEALERALAGREMEILSFKDPSIIEEANKAGRVTHGCARRLLDLYEQAAGAGANILLNACSSVGDVAKAAQPLFKMTGVRIVRIDEAMAMEAARSCRRIGIVATLRSTLEPTKRLVMECALRQGVSLELVEALADGAFGLDRGQFMDALIATGRQVAGSVDALLFAQGSMAYAARAVSEALSLPVLSSIGYGAAEVRAAAEAIEKEIITAPR
jgi:aspartate/glutamate racemase